MSSPLFSRVVIAIAIASAGGLFSCHTARANDHNHSLEEVVVRGRHTTLLGEARSASEGVVGQIDLAIRPMLRPGDVLEAVPGMIVTQHSGSGKSNQMYLRGFNLDHGTDFATWIDGMPVNLRSHGHGQGYTDINFVIPETIETLRFVKGPYHADLGDFSSAGGAHIQTINNTSNSAVKFGYGENGFGRLLGMGSTDLGHGSLIGALEIQRYDGPWDDVDEDVEKLNGLLKWRNRHATGAWGITAMHYQSEWNSADQIPARAVQQGIISAFGSLDPTLGGETHRSSLSADFTHAGDRDSASLNLYAIDYQLQLWSNFTYGLERPSMGDQFEQFDDRMIYGANGEYRWHISERLEQRIGFDIRVDDIGTVGLYPSEARTRVGITREDSVRESSAGVFYEQNWSLTEHWRLVAGLRGDFYAFDVAAQNSMNSGTTDDFLASPKASLIYRASDAVELYLSMGSGFHSNDARGTTISIDPASGEAVDRVDPLVRSQGAEFGVKAEWVDGWTSSLALWQLSLDSELLFVGDAGTTEASRPSKRWGVEWNNLWQVTDSWRLEGDLAWTETRFTDNADEGRFIPGAIPLVASGAVTYETDSGWFGSFRVRYFSEYPLIEDNSEQSEGSMLASLSAGWQGEKFRVHLDALNLFDSRDHDVDYFYASRLPSEPADGVEDNHYKIFEPRQIRANVSVLF